jgi:hypothetical protein
MLSTFIKDAINRKISFLNLKLDTLTRERAETDRVEHIRRRGYFDRQAFGVLEGFAAFNPHSVLRAFSKYAEEIGALMSGGAQPGLYDPSNAFFQSPDAEILYLMVRTLVIRQAIADGGIKVNHVAIDPCPRAEITEIVDRLLLTRYEHLEDSELINGLGPNDILFIDSSHEARVANDVARLFCCTLPALAHGVVVHIHDVFFPFDYPAPFCERYPNWAEQYLVQLYLYGGHHEILWPGYYVQKMRPEIVDQLPILRLGTAQSLWLRTQTQ